MKPQTDVFLKNLLLFERLDNRYLKNKIFPAFQDFLLKNRIIWFYIDALPQDLKHLSTSAVRYGEYQVILLLNSELQEISKGAKQPLNFVCNVGIIHEISHLIAAGFGKFHDENYVWNLGEHIAKRHGIPEYSYYKIRQYIESKYK